MIKKLVIGYRIEQHPHPGKEARSHTDSLQAMSRKISKVEMT
jgi:hypothetical protein